MAELTLNINEWLCGGTFSDIDQTIGKNFLGNRGSYLLNYKREGDEISYEHSTCCLGQFLKQSGVNEEHIFGNVEPAGVRIPPEEFNASVNRDIFDIFAEIDDGKFGKEVTLNNTETSEYLMSVNDDENISVITKIKKIRGLLEKEGHTLKVIDPENELTEIRSMD